VSTQLRNLRRRIFTCSGWSNSTAVDYYCQDKRYDEERVSAGWTRFPIFPFSPAFQTYYFYYLRSKFLFCKYSSKFP